jgi:hypothetical protein
MDKSRSIFLIALVITVDDQQMTFEGGILKGPARLGYSEQRCCGMKARRNWAIPIGESLRNGAVDESDAVGHTNLCNRLKFSRCFPIKRTK